MIRQILFLCSKCCAYSFVKFRQRMLFFRNANVLQPKPTPQQHTTQNKLISSLHTIPKRMVIIHNWKDKTNERKSVENTIIPGQLRQPCYKQFSQFRANSPNQMNVIRVCLTQNIFLILSTTNTLE